MALLAISLLMFAFAGGWFAFKATDTRAKMNAGVPGTELQSGNVSALVLAVPTFLLGLLVLTLQYNGLACVGWVGVGLFVTWFVHGVTTTLCVRYHIRTEPEELAEE